MRMDRFSLTQVPFTVIPNATCLLGRYLGLSVTTFTQPITGEFPRLLATRSGIGCTNSSTP
ncbi:unnamed protein product [Staurois parvus]|uniref:Uncharacterized protein n=1 Tax=Staurois parvus TaxID=386267 RepID=A0ABN9FPD8_9NEOB|nr:unnamed protein product [Staurois parvus]